MVCPNSISGRHDRQHVEANLCSRPPGSWHGDPDRSHECCADQKGAENIGRWRMPDRQRYARPPAASDCQLGYGWFPAFSATHAKQNITVPRRGRRLPRYAPGRLQWRCGQGAADRWRRLQLICRGLHDDRNNRQSWRAEREHHPVRVARQGCMAYRDHLPLKRECRPQRQRRAPERRDDVCARG
jgi:hypothetical protein